MPVHNPYLPPMVAPFVSPYMGDNEGRMPFGPYVPQLPAGEGSIMPFAWPEAVPPLPRRRPPYPDTMGLTEGMVPFIPAPPRLSIEDLIGGNTFNPQTIR